MRGNEEEYLQCPECSEQSWVSQSDPDATWSDMLSHIRSLHWNTDQTPSVLWPRIKVITR